MSVNLDNVVKGDAVNDDGVVVVVVVDQFLGAISNAATYDKFHQFGKRQFVRF